MEKIITITSENLIELLRAGRSKVKDWTKGDTETIIISVED